MDKTKNPKKTISTFTLLINLGTYEGKIYSIKLNPKVKEIIDKFSFSCSNNAIRTITHNTHFIFVSGTDEIIHIYDMKNKKSNGDLMTYSGSINDIKICKNWLIAAGDEPTIPLWRMNDFINIINIKGHKSSVNSIDIHHSGGFLISCGRDRRIIIFDMMTGRKIEKFELDYICNKVKLFHKSKNVLAVFDLHIYIFDLMKNSTEKNDAIIQKIDFRKKIIDAFVIKNKLVVIFTDCEINVFILIFGKKKSFDKVDMENFVSLTIESPKKENENDLDIRPRYITIGQNETLKILTVVYSNNDIYLFDMNKILNWTKEKGEMLKKYYNLNLAIKDKITSVDSLFN